MKTDIQLQHDILDELKWEPSVEAAEIGVTVEAGVATLGGHVRTYTEKVSAERAAQRVAGVEAVANEIEVRPAGAGARTDTDIARAALEALAWHSALPAHAIKVAVSRGWVTLDGQVDWQYQREEAECAVSSLLGVRGVINEVAVKPRTTAADLKSRIEAAFKRSAEIDAGRVQIESHGDTIILHGDVRSWAERQEAERTAWAAPGVAKVINKIAVAPYATAY